ncbi:MAG: hypothetical protein ABIK65_01555 [Candidatus Eisenbacteria bacterium]
MIARTRSWAPLAAIALLPAAVVAGFGPMVWSPNGEFVVSWHRARIASMPLAESKAVWLTDSLPPPPAIAVSWENSTLFVPAGGDGGSPARVDRYSPEESGAEVCLVGFKTLPSLLLLREGRAMVAGPGYCDVRDPVSGALLDSLRWSPPVPPRGLRPWEGGCALLLEDRLVVIDGEPGFRSLPASSTGIALAPFQEGPALLVLREGSIILAGPGDRERLVGNLEPGEIVIGADVTPDGHLAALAIRVDPGSAAPYPSRIDVRVTDTGDLAKRFRSARILSGEKDFEVPVAAAFDPSGRFLALSWPSSGTQIWAVEDWSLHSLY